MVVPVRLDVDVAGYSGESSDDSQRTSTLLPVATYEEAAEVFVRDRGAGFEVDAESPWLRYGKGPALPWRTVPMLVSAWLTA